MKKGFVPILLIIMVAAIAIGSVSYALYASKTNTTGVPTSQIRNLTQTEMTNQNSQKTDILQQLLDKMKSYSNYQLDMVITLASKSEINWKFLRAEQKMFNSDSKLSQSSIVTYADKGTGKSFTYLQDKNEYGEGKSTGNEFAVGTPEYYFKDWTGDVKVKGDDVTEGQEVTVYENTNGSNIRTAYISTGTGLPVKIVQQSSSGEVITTFKFSRINEVQEAEVTLPANAKKIVNL